MFELEYEAKFMMKVEDIKVAMQRITKQLTLSKMWLLVASASKSRVRKILDNLMTIRNLKTHIM